MTESAALDGSSAWKRDLGIALCAVVLVTAVHALQGFPTLIDANGDNDSLLRLVQVRDLIAGQGWFDLHQYRMGPDGGFLMHWSRLVDAPIALLLLAGGTTFALVAWPALLFCAALFLILRITQRLAGSAALLPAAAIGAVSLYYMRLFNPGAIDHHNAQLVLTLAMIWFLVDAIGGRGRAWSAGLCAALMLAVGMETAPYVAIGGAVATLWYLVGMAESRRVAQGFGLGFGLGAVAVFVATVGPQQWSAPACDGFSVVQFAIAGLAGFGLAGIAASRALSLNWPRRLMSLAALGVAVIALILVAFPQCLADPYAMVDPRLRTYWLDSVTEAQPLWELIAYKSKLVASYYATPVLALCCIVWQWRRRGFSAGETVVAAFLAGAFLVSVWQVRGGMFSVPLAVIPLSVWVSEWRLRARGRAPLATTLKMVLAWVFSFSVTWSVAGASVTGMLQHDPTTGPDAADIDGTSCQKTEDYAALAALPTTRVLVVSNLGAPVLRHTLHRVPAGPYHRNNAGNLIALSAFMDPPNEAHAIIRKAGISILAHCPGNPESPSLASWAPQGLMAALMRGDVPDWLEPIDTNGSLRLYRVR